MSSRRGPPKHQNSYAWKPNAGCKINETEVGGKFRPYSEITGVCPRCKEQIDWKRRYGKYKPLAEPAKCQRCLKRAVRQAYHNLCPGCAKEQRVCAKCRCRVDRIVGRDSSEVEAEQKMLDEVNKGKSKSLAQLVTDTENMARESFPSASLEEYAKLSRDQNDEEEEEEEEEEDVTEDEELVLE
ncbi:hypothetical protein CJ030_MR6G021370 [Morella rubra]|uniref:Uncharacterized protein n=1 Tax=Morella rubra TaxID=262757 RepID=A0A6A1VK52_9ROSI|nr:hypothetical protein CJ030_MR6G021370 [Morella rubra]